MKIWLFGDSFSANNNGWPKLATYNFSSNGSSEYRIWKTYQEHKDQIGKNDHVVFCHTSPTRVFLKDDKDLISRNLDSHTKCDLIFNDVYSKNETEFINTLETIWDDDYFMDTFNMIVSELRTVPNSVHFTFFESETITSLFELWQNNKGKINHMNETGNAIVVDVLASHFTRNRVISFGASLATGYGLEDPDTEAYPVIVAKKLNCGLVNKAINGCSNMQILHEILKFDFRPTDKVIVMWAPAERDYIFESKNKYTEINSWDATKEELFKHWAHIHSEHDLYHRSWMNVQHATLFLKSKYVNSFHFAGYLPPFESNKPSYIDVELLDSRVDKYKLITKNASDGLHPGPMAHKMLADRIIKIINNQ